MDAEGTGWAVLRLDDSAGAAMLPRRDSAGHKGSHGTLLCLVGSAQYAGAALLVAASAARGGAGLVALAVPASVVPLVAGRVPEAITLALPEADDDVEPAGALEVISARPAEALVVGCGLAESEGNRRLLVELLSQLGAPAVVDGGALSLLAAERGVWRGIGRTCVLTPHPGEFARLTGRPVGGGADERIERAREAAAAFGQLVVLKGARTVICEPAGRTAVAPFANPALGSAGTGDVLAGLIGALLAQGLAPWEAACLGVYLHGLAGERLRERLGEAGPVASDLPIEVALARRALTGGRRD
ncbi:MAG TPA: NAD(P)H-hydrate dehydratase [Candidatus Limnocylindria bacterium]|nr:NAD(P)H-hydrate dehydratase [Candidatus Limnocylindria bacterium]